MDLLVPHPPMHLQIDLMVLYSPEAITFIEDREDRGLIEEGLTISRIVDSIASTNEAMSNSGIDLNINIVRVDEVSFEMGLPRSVGSKYMASSSAVRGSNALLHLICFLCPVGRV